MPLVTITSKPAYHPLADKTRGTLLQKMVAQLARELPELLVGKTKKLHMDPDTPVDGVQVTHQKFHAQSVNTPDVWIQVQFSEGNLTEAQKTKVKNRLKKLIIGWFTDNGHAVPENLACDVFWIPSHGFLRFSGGATQYDW